MLLITDIATIFTSALQAVLSLGERTEVRAMPRVAEKLKILSVTMATTIVRDPLRR
jgi:hypothetical protein